MIRISTLDTMERKIGSFNPMYILYFKILLGILLMIFSISKFFRKIKIATGIPQDAKNN